MGLVGSVEGGVRKLSFFLKFLFFLVFLCLHEGHMLYILFPLQRGQRYRIPASFQFRQRGLMSRGGELTAVAGRIEIVLS